MDIFIILNFKNIPYNYISENMDDELNENFGKFTIYHR